MKVFVVNTFTFIHKKAGEYIYLKQQQEYESSSDDSESSDDEDNSRKPQNKMSPIEQVQTPEKRLEKSPSSSTNVSLEDDIPDRQDWIQIRVPGREIPKQKEAEKLEYKTLQE